MYVRCLHFKILKSRILILYNHCFVGWLKITMISLKNLTNEL